MPDASPLGEGLVLLAGGGIGAGILKLAQIWIEKRGSAPSRAKDSADLMAATAAFQVALNSAAQGIVGDLRSAVDRLEAEVDDLKLENEQCRAEGEQLRQTARQLEQKLDSLMRQLRDPQATRPGGSLSGAVIEISDGDVTVTKP